MQQYNAEMVELLSAHFPLRKDSSFAWGNAIGGFLYTPKLRGFWGTSSEVTIHPDLSGHGRTLTGAGGTNHPEVTQVGITSYSDFIRANTQYYYRADEPGLSITLHLGLWAWVQFHAPSSANQTSLLSKWAGAGTRSYLIHKANDEHFNFSVSDNGTNILNVNDIAAVDYYTVGDWYFVYGRYTPSVELALFVGRAKSGRWDKYTNIAGVYASLFDGNQNFEVGRDSTPGNYLDGSMSLWGLCAYAESDAAIFNKFSQSRPMFI
jgi:hypothetical protein